MDDHKNISEEIGDATEGVVKLVEEIATEKDLIEHSEHKKAEEVLLVIRNIAVCIAMVLFIISLIHHIPHHAVIRGVGYIFGAGAYFTELLMMTDCFREKLDHKELFMAYCFFPMYLIFAISYFLE